ncbi:MAG: HugZ family protein [Rhodococcus sp. (in: high G+C Gram-positive bacteria)]
MALDHGDPGDAPSTPPPLKEIHPVERPTAAEEARTVAASTNIATLASLSEDGAPWASYVTYGMVNGSPVLCVSRMAEHGRNLHRDHRASLSIVAPESAADPLAVARVTLAGVVEEPRAGEMEAARAAHLDAVPAAKYYIDYSDFTLWILRVHRARWVGGYGRMDSATSADYLRAKPDPISPNAAGAIEHLNDDHASSLLEMARHLGGFPDATSATCTSADRHGLDLSVSTPRDNAATRVGYAQPIGDIAELRAATVELARRARNH